MDVPGHRDFIENMLAGVGGIDAALFVVAADEGVMPQTREHLAILDLLRINGGVVALTKIDLVGEDEASRDEWLDLVEADLRGVLAEHGAARTRRLCAFRPALGWGLDELKAALSACLAERPPRPDLNRPRLPVDRVFTIAGFGTVVTGTLIDGRLQVGDEVEILPSGLRGRVRGLQTHKQKEQVAVPGSRTAVNISGVALEEMQRGQVVAHPGRLPAQPAHWTCISVCCRMPAPPLKHNTEVKLFIGAAEVVARLRLLGVEELAPGEEGWLQLELAEPVVAIRGDRYILRRPSPGETLGGGAVVDPFPKGRHKRFAAETLAALEALAQGTPAIFCSSRCWLRRSAVQGSGSALKPGSRAGAARPPKSCWPPGRCWSWKARLAAPRPGRPGRQPRTCGSRSPGAACRKSRLITRPTPCGGACRVKSSKAA